MDKRIRTGISLLMGLFVAIPSVVTGQEVMRNSLPSVNQILERYVAAVGGRDALERLSTRECIGKQIAGLTSRQQPIYESHYFKAYAKMPVRYYTEEWTDAGIYRRGYDGEVGWIKDKCGVKRDESAGRRRLDWLLNPQNALRIEEYFPSLTLEGTEHVRGHTVYVLRSPELHRPLFFDTTTGLLIGFGHNWEIHDYREVDRVLFPRRVHLSRKGGSTVYEFSEIKHNVIVDDSIFTVPTAAAQ